MAETKDQIAADRDRLAAENTALRAQLAATGRTAGAYQPAQLFISEGVRQELEQFGVANVNGRRMTVDEVRDQLAGTKQAGVEFADPAPGLDRRNDPSYAPPATAIRGVDFVYPSVAPGEIDPAVAGTPGINGPAATVPVVDADDVDDDDQGEE